MFVSGQSTLFLGVKLKRLGVFIKVDHILLVLGNNMVQLSFSRYKLFNNRTKSNPANQPNCCLVFHLDPSPSWF